MQKTLTSKSRKVLGWKENLVSTSYGSLEEQTDNLIQVSKACFVRFRAEQGCLLRTVLEDINEGLASFWPCPVAL